MTDVALVSLAATAGLRAADEELASSLRRAGASVHVVVVPRPREVRTFALTDLTWAVSARRVAVAEQVREARAVVYSSATAALLWPRAGAIRFDSLAAANRPGRHGVWQRPVERRRLREASLLVPWSAQALADAPARRAEAVVVPVPVEPSGSLGGQRDIAAITYGAHWQKKGLDVVLAAWLRAGQPEEELVVCGLAGLSVGLAGVDVGLPGADGGRPPGVRFAGSLPREEYRALLRRSRVFVTAPRREDHGIAQLEALADGCALVTTSAPGPYVALPIARELDSRLVVEGANSGSGGDAPEGAAAALAAAIRVALDDPRPEYAALAAEALAPSRRAAVDATVANELLPRLLR